MGMTPAFVLTASDMKVWADDMLAMAEELGIEDMEILYNSDLHELHKRVQAAPVDVVIGHSKGKFITDAEEVPLIRVGFPIEDRVGYHRRAIVGYQGAINLVDEITNAMLANKMVVSSTVMENMDKMGALAGTAIDLDPDTSNGCGSCAPGGLGEGVSA
jgi:nitrogenase molybdenum-iron protein beta chain